MQNQKTEGKLKSGILSVVKYAFAALMFGTIVMLVVATYVAAS